MDEDGETVGRVDAIERAICKERCAQMGEPACWAVRGEWRGRVRGDWPNKECGDPDCHSLACAAEAAIRSYEATERKEIKWGS